MQHTHGCVRDVLQQRSGFGREQGKKAAKRDLESSSWLLVRLSLHHARARNHTNSREGTGCS